METLYSAIFLLLLASNFVFAISPIPIDVAYDELEKLDASCNNLDNCKLPRSADTLLKYTCHCNSFCSELDTCCIDSPYKGKSAKRPMLSCKTVYGKDSSNYFMVDSCPVDRNTGVWEKLCRTGESEDLMSLVPVTSLSTNVTYKNYFCFRCHETGDIYRYWNVNLFSNRISTEESHKNNVVTYNKVNHTWMAPIGKGGTTVPVALGIDIPTVIRSLPKLCVLNVISSCSENWRNDTIRRKCSAYTSIIYISKNGDFVSYRNPHCALCNSEDLEKMLCVLHSSVRASKRPFSFTHLLDINRSDGDKVGEIQRCDDNSIWDPFFDKCRVLKCALPGYVVQNGKCTPS